MKRFYLPNKTIFKSTTIIGSNAIHIAYALRMKIGDHIKIFNGFGSEYLAKITHITQKKIHISIIKNLICINESQTLITIAQSILKNKKMDYIIRSLTELGIYKWIPYHSKYSIPILNKKNLTLKIKRWKKIATESTKQCHRNLIPKISPLKNFKEILNLSDYYDCNIIFLENQTQNNINLTNIMKNNIKNILAVIGPEGGFDKNEIIQAKNKGFIMTNLGSRILRAETATISALTLLQYLFGDMNKKT